MAFEKSNKKIGRDGQLSPFVRRLIATAASLGVPAAQEALEGIDDNRTELLNEFLERFNESIFNSVEQNNYFIFLWKFLFLNVWI